MHNLPCFGVLYDQRAKECQICDHSIECWGSTETRLGKVTTGHAIAILKFILQERKVTVDQIKKELDYRFKKDLNAHYYLSLLKEQGLIDMKIEGRKRYYVLR